MGQIQQAARDQQRRARRARRRTAARRRARTAGPRRASSSTSGKPSSSSGASSGAEVKRQRAPVLGALVDGPVAEAAVGAPAPASSPVVCGLRCSIARSATVSPAGTSPSAPSIQTALADRVRRPRALGHPAARPLGVVAGRRDALLHPGAQHRLVHDAGLDALQPVVPPAQALLQEADRRPGLAVLREVVRPRADQALARAGQRWRAAAGSRSCSRRPSRRRRTRAA